MGPRIAVASILLLTGCSHRASAGPPDFLLTIQPMGRVSKRTLMAVENAVSSTYNIKFTVDSSIPLPAAARYAPRKRWLADAITAQRPASATRRTIFIVSEDISRPAHGYANFGTLGVGTSDGNAVVSTFRMRGDEALLRKITIHEMGHVFGLPHCPDPHCVMQDLKGRAATLDHSSGFCAKCRAKIARWLKPAT